MTRVFSGIQPTGRKHLGNYLGAIRQYVADQERYGADSIFCVVDLHSMTVPFEPEALRAYTRDTAAILLAAGLDPDRCTLFVQSQVRQHSELTWTLNCVASMGQLNRMVAFKEKSEGRDSVSVGLFDYPVLMAADILLYRTTRVPVGEDQRQHVELARDLAERFNARFGETFAVPQAAIPEIAARVRDLQDPTRQMSTTRSEDRAKVHVLDEPSAIRKKIMSAVTDSGGEIVARPDKPGVTNLLEILSAIEGRPVRELEARYGGKGYGDLKRDVADAVIEELRPVRERFHELTADRAQLDATIARGAERAAEQAEAMMEQVRERVGLLLPPSR